MDIGRLKNNKQYCAWWPERDILLWLKENPEFNLCICYDYFAEIFGKPIFNGEPWVGFTRDYQEDKGGWETASEIENIDEYIWDMLRYKGREYSQLWEETPEVFNLIIDFLTYAKETNQTVIVEVQ